MAVQQETNQTNKPFVLNGLPVTRDNETVSQDAGRGAANMVFGTLMAYNPTTAEWEPLTDETATDGTAHPRGILMQLLLAADIVAGDIDGVSIMVGGDACFVDRDQIVIENSKTFATIVNVPTNLNASVESLLRLTGIFPESTIDTTEFA